MKVLAFGASISDNSINQQFAAYAASLVPNAEVELLDLNDYMLPFMSSQKEKEIGQPDIAKAFLQKFIDADAIIISFAEYNGSYSAAYKNTFDWASRIDRNVFQNKPMLMLATSPGLGGAQTVLASATTSAPYFAADLKGSLSVPSFYDNFDLENAKLSNEELNEQLILLTSQLV